MVIYNQSLTQIYNTFAVELFGWEEADSLYQARLSYGFDGEQITYNLALRPRKELGGLYLIDITPIGLESIADSSKIEGFQITKSTDYLMLENQSDDMQDEEEHMYGTIGEEGLNRLSFVTKSSDSLLFSSLTEIFRQYGCIIPHAKKILGLIWEYGSPVHIGFSESYNEFGYGYDNIKMKTDIKTTPIELWLYNLRGEELMLYQGDIENRRSIADFPWVQKNAGIIKAEFAAIHSIIESTK
ncbi:MAG: hypothetical protein NDI94_01990 [Candidatus Woesearchaeota archaeon]|nr:hypothetical protein [Candidatus Woesearchaeota archaeon]